MRVSLSRNQKRTLFRQGSTRDNRRCSSYCSVTMKAVHQSRRDAATNMLPNDAGIRTNTQSCIAINSKKGTRAILASLHQLQVGVQCPLCHKVMDQPATLGGCAHSFCLECVQTHTADNDTCPVKGCGIPCLLNGRTIRTNPNLNCIIESYKMIYNAIKHSHDYWWEEQHLHQNKQQVEDKQQLNDDSNDSIQDFNCRGRDEQHDHVLDCTSNHKNDITGIFPNEDSISPIKKVESVIRNNQVHKVTLSANVTHNNDNTQNFDKMKSSPVNNHVVMDSKETFDWDNTSPPTANKDCTQSSTLIKSIHCCINGNFDDFSLSTDGVSANLNKIGISKTKGSGGKRRRRSRHEVKNHDKSTTMMNKKGRGNCVLSSDENKNQTTINFISKKTKDALITDEEKRRILTPLLPLTSTMTRNNNERKKDFSINNCAQTTTMTPLRKENIISSSLQPTYYGIFCLDSIEEIRSLNTCIRRKLIDSNNVLAIDCLNNVTTSGCSNNNQIPTLEPLRLTHVEGGKNKSRVSLHVSRSVGSEGYALFTMTCAICGMGEFQTCDGYILKKTFGYLAAVAAGVPIWHPCWLTDASRNRQLPHLLDLGCDTNMESSCSLSRKMQRRSRNRDSEKSEDGSQSLQAYKVIGCTGSNEFAYSADQSNFKVESELVKGRNKLLCGYTCFMFGEFDSLPSNMSGNKKSAADKAAWIHRKSTCFSKERVVALLEMCSANVYDLKVGCIFRSEVEGSTGGSEKVLVIIRKHADTKDFQSARTFVQKALKSDQAVAARVVKCNWLLDSIADRYVKEITPYIA